MQQEFRLTSNFDGPFNFVAGAAYYEDNLDFVVFGNLGFVDLVLRILIDFKTQRKEPLVIMAWGKEAQKCIPEDYSEEYIHVIATPHPAAEAYSGGNSGFFGSKPFTRCNEFLDKFKKHIQW